MSQMTWCRELSANQIAALCRGLHWSRSLEELNIEYDRSSGKVRLIGVLVIATFSVLSLHIQFVLRIPLHCKHTDIDSTVTVSL